MPTPVTAPTTAPTPLPSPSAAPGPAGTNPGSPAPPVATPTAPSGTWTIRPGDHLWRVASTTLAGQWQAAASDAQVLDYLHELIAANRDRLVVPTDPDLVFPGQVFVLPPVPTRPT